MKGIVLAGGLGTRLRPMTNFLSKQLLPIYDKPMIYYPISVLMLAGIREILIISTPEHLPMYKGLLGSGKNLGLEFQYKIQEKPEGLGQAIGLGEEFIADQRFMMILGDNIFWGPGLTTKLQSAVRSTKQASVFAYQVRDPKAFGVLEFSEDGSPVSIEEKPQNPKSNWAITGLYTYDPSVIAIAKNIKKSMRGEYEISSINQVYLESEELNVEVLGRGYAWIDTGTPNSMLRASHFVQSVQETQGYQLACLEEIAFRNGWITVSQLADNARRIGNNNYGDYLNALIQDKGTLT